MKIKLRAFLLLCFAFNAFNIWAIETQVPDTGLILTKDAFLAIVKQYHPIMAQANITVEKANSQILTARGGFDPLFTTGYENKTFNNKDYYNYNAINLTIPTWYGLDINAGTEYVDGYYANPEKSQGQSSYIGVKLPLGNGLLFDKRRAALRQAQAMQQLAEADRRLAVNNLIYESISTYLNWQKEYNQLLIVNELVQNNIERIKIIKTEYEQGLRPAIDTTEAWAQLYNLLQVKEASTLAFQNAGLDILNYLWLPGFIPYNNINKIVPDTNLKSTYDAYKVANILESALQNHPKLNAIQSKINALNYEQKAKIQDLLPKIDLKGNVLYKKYNFNLPVDNTYLFENNKVGIDIRMPLFIREARGAYKNVKLKIKETEYDMSYNTAIISNKIKSYYNEITSLEKQVGFFTQNYQNIAKLYNAEITKLMAGESTLFLVNNRENKLLETKQKLIELQTKYQKSFYSLYWSAGILQ